MRKLILAFVAVSAVVAAAEPVYFGTALMTRDGALVPNVAVPTPAEVAAVGVVAESAWTTASALTAEQVELGGDVETLAVRVTALGGQVIVYGTCVAFGSQAMAAPTNVTATILGMTFPSNTVDTVYVNLYVYYSEAMESTGVQVASSLSAAWGATPVLESQLTTYPVAGSPVECYRMLIGLPAAAAGAFMRATGDVQAAVVGQFSVLEGLTVNGVAGSSVTNSLGIFKFGLLVTPLEGM